MVCGRGRWGHGEEAEVSYMKFSGVLQHGGISTQVRASAAGAPLDQAHSWDVDLIPAKKLELGS